MVNGFGRVAFLSTSDRKTLTLIGWKEKKDTLILAWSSNFGSTVLNTTIDKEEGPKYEYGNKCEIFIFEGKHTKITAIHQEKLSLKLMKKKKESVVLTWLNQSEKVKLLSVIDEEEANGYHYGDVCTIYYLDNLSASAAKSQYADLGGYTKATGVSR